MTPLSDADITRIAQGVLDRSLPKPEWTHQAHFAAALWLIRHQPGFDDARDMPGIIRAYNDATNTPNTDRDGYHHSITLASMAVARAALAAAPEVPLSDVLSALMAGPCGQSGWLLVHWRRDTLFSVEARRGWVPPDLAPLRI
jgi:hypothetical protein